MKTFEPSWNRGSSPIPQQQITSRRFSSLVVISSGRHGFHKWCLLRNSSSQMENYALLTWDRSMGFFQPLYIATPGFHSTLKERSGGQTYRQGCNRPLRVQKASRHHGTLVISQPNGLLLLSDQNAYTGPTILQQSRRGSSAQGHNAHIFSGEWVPRLEVISNELCACVGPGKSIS